MATDAQRKAARKWDSENMSYQTIKVKKTLLEDFKAACTANGDKVNTVLRQAMELYAYGEKSKEASEQGGQMNASKRGTQAS